MAIGDDVRHPEWDERTAGRIAYTGDVRLDGMLVGKILRSPHPHARILAIDTSAARRLAGVAAVLTAADLPERNYLDYGQQDRPALARGLVRHIGQEVAVAAAESEAEAERAIAAIRVRYRPLRAATDAAAALRANAPLVHPERGRSNVATITRRSFGETGAAPDGAGRVHRAAYEYGIQAHACMEPQAAVAAWDAQGGIMHLWTPTQSARNLQHEIAHMLELEPERVRLHRVAVGGDFGARVRASDIEVLAAHLSRHCGRPVAIELSRGEEFAHGKHQHASRIEIETRVARDGAVTGRRARLTVENGAFIHGGSNMMSYCGILLAAQYRLAGAEIEGRSVYTHRRPGGSFRGAGGPQAVFAIESQMDEIAAELGVDPIDFRLDNVNRADETTITGWEIGSCEIAACIEAVRERLDWKAARRDGGGGRGVGMAIAMHCSGAVVSPGTGRAAAAVEIGHNSGIALISGCSDPGTGEAAMIAQICAAELGVAVDAIALRVMDTATTPYDPGAGASRATHLTGGAVLAASRAMAESLREVAAARFGTVAAEVELRDGFARHGRRRLSLGELAALHPDGAGGLLHIEREHAAGVPVVPMAATDPGYGNLSPSYSFAAHGVEVEVDRATGAVRVVRVVAAHDSGTVINPVGARGQVVGGVVMGLGAALGEQLLYQDGRAVNPSYADYVLMRAPQAPPIEVVFVGAASPRGPHGAKSVAEIALMPTAAAVANAVAHAVGVRVRELPISPDRVLRGLRRAAPDTKALWRRPRRWRAAAARALYPRGLHWALHRWGTRLAAPPAPARPIARVVAPTSAEAAVAALAADPHARPIGGGTDLLVCREQGLAAPTGVVDLAGCDDLLGIDADGDADLTIGAAATLADIERRLRASTRGGDRAVADTIAAIASAQIRATATLAGNLCQANRCWYYRGGFTCYKRGGATCPCYAVTGDHRYFHAVLDAGRCQAVTPSDLATTLTALDARLEVKEAGGATRRMPLADLYDGPGETVLGQDRIIASLTVPAAARDRATRFEKLALYEGGFAVVSACVSLARDGAGIGDCRIVLGGVANTPYRARASERALLGRPVGAAAIAAAARAWARHAHPLPGNGWKVDAACGLLQRVLTEILAP